MHIQSDPPDQTEQANWLPSPESGPFYLVLRLYLPKPAAMDGTWSLPPIQLV